MAELLRTRDTRIPLGEILVRRNLISPQQLDEALGLQARTGSRLGDILISEGMVRYDALYQCVAESSNLPFVNLLKMPPHAHLPLLEDCEEYLRFRLMPWREEGDTLYIAVCEVTFGAVLWMRQRYGVNTRMVITSPFDIDRTVMQFFGTELEEDSRMRLWLATPHASARETLAPQQAQAMLGYAATGAVMFAAFPGVSMLAATMFCHVAYMFTMLFKCAIFSTGVITWRGKDWDARLKDMDTHRLPVYSVLVPMYKEAASLPGLLAAMQALDYPACKLDIKLVLEEDDTEMLEAARALKPSYQFDIIRVPPGKPRTKPKACNYALRFARGEYLTIFDADDRPDPLQLKKAVYTFRHSSEDVVCLQARLNYYNRHDNLLTRFFCLEYLVLFAIMLPGLERLRIPIPLGGTSNHIDFKRLVELGAWDPYNVTEDADLGTRIAARGLRTAMLDSDTMEEAPNTVGAWIRQRSRWIKGYMQTWLVHMRNPVKLYRTLGARSFWGFQFFVGFSTFTFLSAPVVWGVALLWVGGVGFKVMPVWLVNVALINMGLNIGSNWAFTLFGAHTQKGDKGLMVAALLYPLYLILHSIASYKALWQLVVNPHYWEKTTHGLSFRTVAQPMSAPN